MTDDPPKIRYKPTPLLVPNERTYKQMLEYGAFRLPHIRNREAP